LDISNEKKIGKLEEMVDAPGEFKNTWVDIARASQRDEKTLFLVNSVVVKRIKRTAIFNVR
jgi:hypothetical protein